MNERPRGDRRPGLDEPYAPPWGRRAPRRSPSCSVLLAVLVSSACEPGARPPFQLGREGGHCVIGLCESSLLCIDDLCVPAYSQPLGEPCERNQECVSGLCRWGACAEDYDTPLGGRCFDSFDCNFGLRCAEGVCVEYFPGSEGDVCSADDDCFYWLVCDPRPASRCVLPGPEGTPCAQDKTCADGLACNAAYGSSCTRRRPDIACTEDADCLAGSKCRRGPEGDGLQCLPPGSFGQGCDEDLDCRPGFGCRELAVWDNLVERFGFNRCVCESEECPEGESCGEAGCTRVRTVAEGEACAYDANCAPGNVCAWAEWPYVCRPPSQDGEPCGSGSDCASGLWCDAARHACFGDCGDEPHCALREFCLPPHHEGCLPLREAGSECTTPQECLEGLVCLSKSDGGGRCAAPRADGEACSAPDECAAGLECLEGLCYATLPLGAPCSPIEPPRCGLWSKCIPSNCERFDCDMTAGACQDPLKVGESCPCTPALETLVSPSCADFSRLYGSGCVNGAECKGWLDGVCEF